MNDLARSPRDKSIRESVVLDEDGLSIRVSRRLPEFPSLCLRPAMSRATVARHGEIHDEHQRRHHPPWTTSAPARNCDAARKPVIRHLGGWLVVTGIEASRHTLSPSTLNALGDAEQGRTRNRTAAEATCSRPSRRQHIWATSACVWAARPRNEASLRCDRTKGSATWR